MSLTAKVLLTPLLVAQAIRTRARIPKLPEAEGERHGSTGSGPPLRLLIAGDSSAAGVGVVHQREALAAPLAAELAARLEATVQWKLVARSGLNSAQTLHLPYLLRPPRDDRGAPRWLTPYVALAAWCLRHRLATMGGAAAFFFGSFALVPLLPTGFVPPDDLSQTQVYLSLPPGNKHSENLVR